MANRFWFILFFPAACCFVSGMVWAADVCVPEYRPLSGKYLLSSEESASIKLSPAERGTILSTWHEYGEKTASLYRDFEFQRAELISKLIAFPASREGADAAAVKMLSTLEEIAGKNVDWQRALSMNISVGHLNSLAVAHQKGQRGSGHPSCGLLTSRLDIPLFRHDLNGREKVIIGLTEEEQANLDLFIKHNISLRDEYRSLVRQLDAELSRREPESKRLETLLGLLAINMRQDVTNALDGYFYGEVNFFTPERTLKLRKYWDKHRIKK
jgi:hypothetical protein